MWRRAGGVWSRFDRDLVVGLDLKVCVSSVHRPQTELCSGPRSMLGSTLCAQLVAMPTHCTGSATPVAGNSDYSGFFIVGRLEPERSAPSSPFQPPPLSSPFRPSKQCPVREQRQTPSLFVVTFWARAKRSIFIIPTPLPSSPFQPTFKAVTSAQVAVRE